MISVIVAFLVGLLLGIHKNVIKAVVAKKPIPQAPASHFWVKNRRSN